MVLFPLLWEKGGSHGTSKEVIAERPKDPLLDRKVAFRVRRGVTVLPSAAEFGTGLTRCLP